MRLTDTLALAVWSLGSRPVRSALLVLTLAAGVAAVSLAAAVTNGYARELERIAFGAYARSLVITENWASQDRFGPPRVNDLEDLREALGDQIEGAAVWREDIAGARGEREISEVRVYGVTGDYRFEAAMALAAGRHLTREELDGAEPLCLLGDRAARDLFPEHAPEALPGRTVRLAGVPCEIAGVFKAPDTRTADLYSEAVIAPFLAAGRYFQRGTSLAPNEASRLTVILRDRDLVHAARTAADRTLRRAHGAPLSGPAPFRYADPAAGARAMERQGRLLSRLLYAVAVITLAASVIGYAAATHSSIDMRRRDIALQMACGAAAGDVSLQILGESLLLGCLGAVLGASLAALAAPVSQSVLGAPAVFDVGVAAAALGVGMGAGALAGLWPARRAAAAPPAAAMRA
ncbi:MAG: ABC transporter permease [Oceanicaulis sp.]